MTTALLSLPIFRAFDTAGLPLAGGLLYSYAANTLTPQNTYSDNAGSSPNTNPVVLDSTGSAVVRLDPALVYKFVLKTSAGTTLWTVDYYQADNLTASSIGATLWPLTAAESAASITPTNYGYAPGDVRRYGAVGDGATDDTAALMRAIGCGAQYVYGHGSDTYLIGTAGLQIASLTGLRFVGNGATLKIGTAATQTVTGGDASQILMTSCTDVQISDWKMDGNSKAANWIGMNGNTDCKVTRNKIFSSGVNAQVFATNNTRCEYSYNTVYTGVSVARGLWIGNSSASQNDVDALIIGNTVRNHGATGIVVVSLGGRVVGNHARTNDGSGIIFSGNAGVAAARITCTGNYCIDNLFHGIQADVPSYSTDADLPVDITITGNVCSQNNRGSGSGIYAVNCMRWVISGNTCTDNISAGIHADDRAKLITITGNTCSDTRAGGSRTQTRGIRVIAQAVSNSGVTISGNYCDNNTSQGICVQSSAGAITLSNVSVVGNTCTNNAAWGIFMSEVNVGDLSMITCQGNTCAGSGTTDLRLSIRDVAIGGNRYSTHTNADSFDLDSNSATPNIPGRTFWRANNGSVTTITAFNNGVDGQTITVLAANGNTTITNGGSIVLKGGVNVTPTTNQYVTLQKYNTVWRELSRSF